MVIYAFYKEQYPKYRAKMPDAELGHIARAVGTAWKKLGTADQQVKYIAWKKLGTADQQVKYINQAKQ